MRKFEKPTKDIRVTDEVYWKLVEMKFNSRVRSIDEVLRMQMVLPPNHHKVKTYSHERCCPG